MRLLLYHNIVKNKPIADRQTDRQTNTLYFYMVMEISVAGGVMYILVSSKYLKYDVHNIVCLSMCMTDFFGLFL